MEARPEITRKLAEFVHDTSYHDIPEEVIEHSKLLVLDWFAAVLAGSKQKIADVLIDVIDEIIIGNGKGEATIIGRGGKTDVLNAALLNGTMSHALDIDDYHPVALAHPTVTLLPGIIAVAESKKLTGKEIIEAFILSYDVLIRIGIGVGRIHYDRGWHATSTLGRFGATAGVGKLLRLDVKKLINAFGIAATQAGGLQQVFGTMCKPFHAGKSSMDGVLSAFMAHKGFTSSKDIIEGKQGFLAIFSDNKERKGILTDLGTTYHILDTSFKPYASCAFSHSTIDLMREIRKQAEITIDDVEKIEIEVNNRALNVAGKVEPKRGLEGKFSLSHCAAVSLAEGSGGLDMFTDKKVNDQKIVNLRRKVNVTGVEDGEHIFRAKASVKMKNGTKYTEETLFPKGHPRNPLSNDELMEKFREISEKILLKRKVGQIIKSFQRLEEVEDIGFLLGLFNPNN